MTAEGYRIQWVRGVGTASGRWKDVEDAVTTTVADAPVVVLRLRDGRTTTIPVEVLATDREEFVRDLQRHLRRGQGLATALSAHLSDLPSDLIRRTRAAPCNLLCARPTAGHGGVA